MRESRKQKTKMTTAVMGDVPADYFTTASPWDLLNSGYEPLTRAYDTRREAGMLAGVIKDLQGCDFLVRRTGPGFAEVWRKMPPRIDK